MFYAVSLPLLCFCLVLGVVVGSTHVEWTTVLHVFAAKLLPHAWTGSMQTSEADEVIVWLIRMPRVVVAGLVGAGLAAAGVVMQSLFRNPLAEPGLIGPGAGAVLGAVLSFVTGWNAHYAVVLPVSAMAGAMIALVIVYSMATRGGVTTVTSLLLAGTATGILLGAMSSLLLSLNTANWQVTQNIVFWMMGGLEARTWTHVWLCAPFVVAGLVSACVQSRDLDLLQQGEEAAAALGLDTERSRRLLMLTAAVLTGASIAVAGMVGFVGLVIPQAVRLVLGPSTRRLLPASVVVGAAFLILCDLLARVVHPPTEIRLGIVTALIGGPIFIWLLMQQQARGTSR